MRPIHIITLGSHKYEGLVIQSTADLLRQLVGNPQVTSKDYGGSLTTIERYGLHPNTYLFLANAGCSLTALLCHLLSP